MKGVEDSHVVVVYLRVYLCMCVFLHPVPQQEFNLTFDFDDDSCMLTVMCKNGTLPVDCTLSDTSNTRGVGSVTIPVESNVRYEFQGTMRSVRVCQSHQVTDTGNAM